VELSKRLKKSQSFVSKVEQGDRRLDVIQLRSICAVFGMTLREFVDRLERRIERGREEG
jgi:transcriptional regulator with XRE-family HTH domain